MSQTSTGQSKFTRKLTTRSAFVSATASATARYDRWAACGILPPPMRINKVRYWDEAQIEQVERERMARSNEPEISAA